MNELGAHLIVDLQDGQPHSSWLICWQIGKKIRDGALHNAGIPRTPRHCPCLAAPRSPVHHYGAAATRSYGPHYVPGHTCVDLLSSKNFGLNL